MTTWHTFGDKARFAVQYRFVPDPHAGQAAAPAQSASWGAFRIWHRGENLCEHRAQGALHDSVTWHLLPLLQWLVENWDPLFHEQRFPEGVQVASARQGYMKAVKASLGDPDPVVEARAVAWQAWWQRHSLRACREGGLFPDLFIRRVLDYVELSWGNQELPGSPLAFYFTVPAASTYSPIPEIAEPLHRAMQAAIAELGQTAGDLPEVAALRNLFKALEATSSANRYRWYLSPPRPADDQKPDGLGWLQAKMEQAGKQAQSLLSGRDKPLYVEHLSPVVAMFGSLSPNIGARDADRLVTLALAAYEAAREPEALSSHVEDLPLSAARANYDEGYDLALDLLEDLGLPEPDSLWIDIAAVLNRLGIAIHEMVLNDRGVRGVALAGGDVRPTIMLNTGHPMNATEAGRRFTLAHELCHILHDRGFGGHLSLASGPWAPHGIERRANAFAAMLLMPPQLVNRVLAGSSILEIGSLDGIKYLSNTLRTSLFATSEHLVNIGKLDEEDRDRIRTAILEGTGPKE